jgi:hypothetical protein
MVAELLGSIEAFVGLSPVLADEDAPVSELDDALRNFGRPLSSLLFEDVLSSELDVALCNFGRSGSSLLLEELLEELLDEVAELSSELEPARRSFGRSPEVGVPDELLAELVDEALVMGFVGSSVACDAVACSSSVPSFTIAMVWAL